jgi:deoxycytidylate deaminase
MRQRPPAEVIHLAITQATLSPCRSKRGAVIFRDTRIIAHGYNYKPRGFDCDGTEACKATCRVEAVHAEQSALMLALATTMTVRGADLVHVKAVADQLVPSGPPSCVQCSKLLLVAGISGVWLFHDHGTDAPGWEWYDAHRFHALSLGAERLGLHHGTVKEI